MTAVRGFGTQPPAPPPAETGSPRAWSPTSTPYPLPADSDGGGSESGGSDSGGSNAAPFAVPFADVLTGRSAPRGRLVAPGRPVVLGHRVLLASILVAGLLGGGIGALLVSMTERGSDQQASAALPVGTAAPSSDRRSVASIAATALPSVVTIDAGGGGDGDAAGTGSGVIISPEGYILTNNHVVASAVAARTPISVRRYQEFGQVRADLVGRDPKTDIAVLRIPAPQPLPAVTLGQSGSLVVGAPVVAIGAPFGLAGTVTTGVVSALDRNPMVPAESGTDPTVLIGAIQIDAAINPGNSGGPLLDGLGQMVGINTAIAAVPGHESQSQSGSIGVGFAIPIDFARSVAQEIISTGRATHPYLGVSAATVTAGQAKAMGTTSGARVVNLAPGGPAERAGLRVGDIITRVDTRVISGMNDLIVAARLHRVGDRVSVAYERAGATATTQLTLQEQQR
ncbi:trypsin serine protease [Frankia sp. CcI6]|uniref:S1C family serine protease n=1 Tax=unclassified Frankia TaxID=2632575 RepID=UPI0003D05EAC|nr:MULTISPECIES: trypsin-like peptidase domain-containing protein [unclassified Frankia]ETA00568.1 trypsin serine protease [Frankia sp. CcI6]KDA41528.1 trypsin-like serine protease with C-terminal PDZ domain [Frankia sp. BMG5.23]KEZ36273.1 trypsin-like serine protease with C-terminal PDZ domain [Frankia sp. CeD]KFB06342.1 trypsin-like serine protease with C-terminal PDZ domain [Frankia sp. Allo2]